MIKAIATLNDGSFLYVSEAEGTDWREYSYHWQKNEKLMRRWDNAPHHKNLPNFPHHVHDSFLMAHFPCLCNNTHQAEQ